MPMVERRSSVARLEQADQFAPAGARIDVDLDGLLMKLVSEFHAPAGLFDPGERVWRRWTGAPLEVFPDCPPCREALPRAFVLPPSEGDGASPVWLVLPLATAGGHSLVAVVGFARFLDGPAWSAITGDSVNWGPPCPEPALRAWGQVVADRLRDQLGGQSALMATPAPSVADRLIHRLRVSDTPDRFQRLSTATVREAIQVEAVAWVPATHREPVVVSGGLRGLRPEAYRHLVPNPTEGTVWVSNRPAIERSDLVHRIAAAAAVDSTSGTLLGWLVAINPLDGQPLGNEAEVLRTVASLIATQWANARLFGEIKDLLFGVIRSLTAAIDAKDPYTSGHSERVARIAVRLGEELGLSHQERSDLYLMGLLHDIGKIGIEDQVLKKPGALSPEEYRKIQDHVRIGVRILSDLKRFHHLLPGVAAHHEHMDGSGYPAGLRGDQIPIAARILAVADAFDAMSSTRPYRRQMTSSRINEVFRVGKGLQWDAEVVEALFACRDDIDMIRQKGLGESVLRAVGGALDR